MKKRFLLLSASLFLVACHHLDDVVVDANKQLHPVKITISLKEEILPFTKTKAIPSFGIPEPASVNSAGTDPQLPGEDAELTDFCSEVEYLVFDKDDNTMIRHRHYTKTDDDFGIIYDSLPAGSFLVTVVSHSSVCKGVSDQQLLIEDIDDMFYAKADLTISNKVGVVKDIALSRIVSRIEFVSSDIATPNLKSFDMEVAAYPDKIDLLTGKGIASLSGKTFSYTFKSEDQDKANLKFSFLTLVPKEEQVLNVNLVVTDTDDTEYYSHKVDNILPSANRTIRYTGSLYPAPTLDETLVLSIENMGNWGEDIEYELKD